MLKALVIYFSFWKERYVSLIREGIRLYCLQEIYFFDAFYRIIYHVHFQVACWVCK
jgi:hypothetical protein